MIVASLSSSMSIVSPSTSRFIARVFGLAALGIVGRGFADPPAHEESLLPASTMRRSIGPLAEPLVSLPPEVLRRVLIRSCRCLSPTFHRGWIETSPALPSSAWPVEGEGQYEDGREGDHQSGSRCWVAHQTGLSDPRLKVDEVL